MAPSGLDCTLMVMHGGGLWKARTTMVKERLSSGCTVGAAHTSSSLVPVLQALTWEGAQSYCRKHYSDLASVRNQAENFQVQSMIMDSKWIGLHRDAWTWSDGSSLSFSNWDPSALPLTCQKSCAASRHGKWVRQDCDNAHSFVCYSAPQVRKQVVRVVLKKTDSSVDMEELKEGILQKFNQRLMAHGLSKDVKLKWVKQPDGKVFHSVLQEEEKGEKEKSCDTDF
ncbi:putative C-type lectin domain family 20 member A [Pempheris klunzingeri]|uniref:putative C-type lectin domain family 20 member A n=1 Tax=Pempheris klunzingeri TaxID=3127111 RepID=UPI00397ED8DE